MTARPLSERVLPETQFLALRRELLRVSTLMSCDQALDLADLLHTVIRMRKPCRPLHDLDRLFLDEARSFEPDATAPNRALARFGSS